MVGTTINNSGISGGLNEGRVRIFARVRVLPPPSSLDASLARRTIRLMEATSRSAPRAKPRSPCATRVFCARPSPRKEFEAQADGGIDITIMCYGYKFEVPIGGNQVCAGGQ